MNSNRRALAVAIAAALAVAVAGGYGLYRLGASQAGAETKRAPAAAPRPAAAPAATPDDSIAAGEAATRRHLQSGIKAGDVDPVSGRQVLYYQDPMVPGKRFETPGKSPFMDMMLVPVYAGAGGDAGTVSVSPRMQQSLGLRTAKVEQGTTAPRIEAVGAVAYNERDLVVLQARAAGFVEKLHVRAALDRVAAGAPLVDLYVPDWVAAQEEYLALRHMQGERLAPLVDAARLRMRQAGMSEAQIREVESSGSARRRFTVSAPHAGVVTELMVREGMSVAAGASLVRINGLATVWVHAEVPESQAALLRPGASVEARTPFGGAPLAGKVQALLPEVNAGTRTVRARIELPNPGGRLTPGLFVTLSLGAAGGVPALLVPSEAVIQTGRRTVVMVTEGEGRWRPVEVEIGAESNGRSEVRKGLRAGQEVVVSGQFLLDSEASLRAVETKSAAVPATPGTTATPAGASTSASAPMSMASPASAPMSMSGATPAPMRMPGAASAPAAPPTAGSPPAAPPRMAGVASATTAAPMAGSPPAVGSTPAAASPMTPSAPMAGSGRAAMGAAPAAASGAGATAAKASQEHRGTGRIDSIDADGVGLTHGPIASIGWDSMTMIFLKPKTGLPRGLRRGQTVDFSFRMTDDGPLLTRVEPAGPGAANPASGARPAGAKPAPAAKP